ncbi:MAG: hemolysin family protein [Lachnospiraceae bacterium]|nr:hemolysin family protein [Lachnospiraceae bacterium]
MDDGGPTASYAIFFALLLIDMFFYSSGAAIRDLNSKELSEHAQAGDKRAGKLYQIAVNPEQYINTVQLITTVINLIMGVSFLRMFSAMAQQVLEGGYLKGAVPPALITALAFILSGAVLLYVLLTFGVLIPKRLGVRYSYKWAYTCIEPVYFIMKLFAPVTGLITATSKGVLRLFGIHGDMNPEDVTEEEIISMVNEGHEQGVLLATEAEMINNIFEFGDKEAQDIMTHRNNILAIDRNITLEEALDYMLSESKSRFPVFEDNIDHIIGILHFRDAMGAQREKENLSIPVGEIQNLIREAEFVPETKHIDVLFKTMQHTKTQMVIVVDEYGQTSGLLAMEDILEEIVGEIMDEYDEEEAHIEETENADEYIIEGITPLEELEERFQISFHEDTFDTLNGFMISKMEKIPDENEEFTIEVEGYSFRILKVENRVIKSVLVKKLPDRETEETGKGKNNEDTNKQE